MKTEFVLSIRVEERDMTTGDVIQVCIEDEPIREYSTIKEAEFGADQARESV